MAKVAVAKKPVKDIIREEELVRIETRRLELSDARRKVKELEAKVKQHEFEIIERLRAGAVVSGGLDAAIVKDDGKCSPKWKEIHVDHMLSEHGQSQEATEAAAKESARAERVAGHFLVPQQEGEVMNDPTEGIRRLEQKILNDTAGERADLEQRYGQVWDTDQIRADFEVVGFMAPYMVVIRKVDGKKGSLQFQHSPRYYFNWQEA